MHTLCDIGRTDAPFFRRPKGGAHGKKGPYRTAQYWHYAWANGRVGRCGKGENFACNTYRGESTMKYEKPAVQRYGSLRELTLGNGPRLGGDAVSLYHRS